MSFAEAAAASLLFRYAGSASGAYQLHDRCPDFRRQTLPACDKLAERLVVPAMVQPTTTVYVVNDCGATT
jgi:hypothetical protein